MVDKRRKETTQNFPDFDKISLKVEQAPVEMVDFFPRVSQRRVHDHQFN